MAPLVAVVGFRPQAGGLVALAYQQDQRAGTRQRGFGKSDLEHGGELP